MTSELLGRYWKQAGQLLGFTVEAPYVAVLTDGQALEFSAHLPDFGAKRGMLLSDNYESFSAYKNALIGCGYGYSVLSASSASPDPETIIQVLQDWGWSASNSPPEWLGEG